LGEKNKKKDTSMRVNLQHGVFTPKKKERLTLGGGHHSKGNEAQHLAVRKVKRKKKKSG